VPEEAVVWNQQRPTRTLAVNAMQKTMARYADAAGVVARCHTVRHTVAAH
jgi:hypothetical protein